MLLSSMGGGAPGGGAGAAPAGGGGEASSSTGSINPAAYAGAFLPFGGGLAGGYFSGRAKRKAYRTARKRGQLVLNNLRSIQGAWGARTEEELRNALSAIQKGFEGARGEVSNIGAGARQRTLDREQQAQGAVQQGLTNRGLSSTTRQSSALRGVRSDTDRALLEIDDQVAQLQSAILQSGGLAEGDALTNIANFYQQRSAQDTAIEGKRYELLAGKGAAGLNSGGGGFNLSGLGPLIAMLGGQDGVKDYQTVFGAPELPTS